MGPGIVRSPGGGRRPHAEKGHRSARPTREDEGHGAAGLGCRLEGRCAGRQWGGTACPGGRLKAAAVWAPGGTAAGATRGLGGSGDPVRRREETWEWRAGAVPEMGRWGGSSSRSWNLSGGGLVAAYSGAAAVPVSRRREIGSEVGTSLSCPTWRVSVRFYEPTAVLGHILSFLPAQEAGRAAILSRRWRRAFSDVHTISFETRSDDTSYESSSESSSDDDDDKSPNRTLLDRVSAALLARRRCGGVDAPLRSLRVAMPYAMFPSDSYTVDEWFSYAQRRRLQEVFLATPSWAAEEDACRHGCRRVNDDWTDSDSESDSSSSDDEKPEEVYYYPRRYVVPAKLYSCATMRALHLISCSLSTLRSTTIDLPSLQTLFLSRIRYSRHADNIQRLITGCPRVADPTLEACSRITALTVPPNMRLKRLALRCCHDLRRVTVDLSETRSFEYRGVPPDASFLTSVGRDGALRALASAKIDVCWQVNSPGKMDFEKLREFLLLFVGTTSLKLQLGWPDTTNSLYGSEDFFADFPLFSNLTRLELGSRLVDRRVVQGVPGILRRTPNLSALSLKLYGQKRRRKTTTIHAGDLYHRSFSVGDEVPDASVPCLQGRVKEMSVEQYEGADVQRMLLKSLLRGALVLESMRVVFANGRHSVLDELMDEIRSWSRNPATRISFS